MGLHKIEIQLRQIIGSKKMSTLGERIAAAREARGWIQAELAEKMGVSRATISDWEADKIKNLRLENLFKLADKLDTNARWIATGLGTPRKNLVESDEEYELVRIFRTLGNERRRELISAAAAFQAIDYDGKPTKERPFGERIQT